MANVVEIPEQTRRSKRWAVGALVISALVITLVFAASWAEDSRMSSLRWVPDRMARLADQDPNLRTAIPFVPLAFLLVQGFRRFNFKWPLGWSVIICGLCLVLSELGQLFLPQRSADVKDLLWGTVGIVAGGALGWMSSRW